MFRRILTAGVLFGMAATGPPSAAHAQMRCGARAQVIGALKQQHGETILGIGLSGPKAIYEVWRAKKSGSWTILLTRPDNIACVMATGRNWMEAPSPPKPVVKAAMQY